jgi:hypothetical protein
MIYVVHTQPKNYAGKDSRSNIILSRITTISGPSSENFGPSHWQRTSARATGSTLVGLRPQPSSKLRSSLLLGCLLSARERSQACACLRVARLWPTAFQAVLKIPLHFRVNSALRKCNQGTWLHEKANHHLDPGLSDQRPY